MDCGFITTMVNIVCCPVYLTVFFCCEIFNPMDYEKEIEVKSKKN